MKRKRSFGHLCRGGGRNRGVSYSPNYPIALPEPVTSRMVFLQAGEKCALCKKTERGSK